MLNTVLLRLKRTDDDQIAAQVAIDATAAHQRPRWRALGAAPDLRAALERAAAYIEQHDPTEQAKTSSAPKQHSPANGAAPITVYTDGACAGNPGPGGYAAILCLPGGERRELSGAFRSTTNNRMELLAPIAALEALEPSEAPVTVHSDSRYVVDAVEKGWLAHWRKNHWQRPRRKGGPVANPDLWQRLDRALSRHPRITFHWVKAHAGNPLNERADALAQRTLSQTEARQIDHAYERTAH